MAGYRRPDDLDEWLHCGMARCLMRFPFLPRSVDLRSPSSQADPPRPAWRDALDGSAVAATLAHELSWTRDCLEDPRCRAADSRDRKSTRLNSSHMSISYAVFCLKKKKKQKKKIRMRS